MTTSLFLQSCDGPMSAPTDPHDELSRGRSHLGLRPRPPPLVHARPTSASKECADPRALSNRTALRDDWPFRDVQQRRAW